MRKLLGAVFVSVLGVVIAGCQSMPTADSTTTIILVRHAEKQIGAGNDPPLSSAGEQRAQSLARVLAKVPLTAVYSTDTRRTRETAMPSAKAHGLQIALYDPRQQAQLADGLRGERGQTVLVVGHSNTITELAALLCGCTVAPMPDEEFDRRMTVTLAADGSATLTESRQW